jgi:hypothetical protein
LKLQLQISEKSKEKSEKNESFSNNATIHIKGCSLKGIARNFSLPELCIWDEIERFQVQRTKNGKQ